MGSLLVLLAAVAFADGPKLYRENCASCHGNTGAGDGPTAKELRYKPRAFIEGKFAFGNTPDAMVKTVMSGIPGEDGARMPAFKSVLTEDEIRELVDFVRTMMPPQPVLTPADMKMDVTDRAKVIRGILMPLRDGERPLARGLLVGLPSGFSFEYANADRFHLVAVRRGDFATRSDWEGRGGRPLTPLGAAIWVAPPDAALASWVPFAIADAPGATDHAAFQPALAKLRETSAREEGVELGFDLLGGDGKARVHVIEHPREVVVAGGAGIVQEFLLRAAAAPVTLICSFAVSSDPKLPLPFLPVPIGEPSLARHTSEQSSLMNDCGWWVTRQADGSYACVKLEAQGGGASAWNGEQHDCFDMQVTVGRDPVVLRRTTIFRKDATLEALHAMARELQ